MKPFGRILVFSLIETVVSVVALVLWLQRIDGGLFTPNKLLAYAVWIVGFTVEHIAAWNAAKNRPLLDFPPKD